MGTHPYSQVERGTVQEKCHPHPEQGLLNTLNLQFRFPNFDQRYAQKHTPDVEYYNGIQVKMTMATKSPLRYLVRFFEYILQTMPK